MAEMRMRKEKSVRNFESKFLCQ